jgi:hypothetical protein
MIYTKVLAVDTAVVEGSRRCTKCGRAKPADQVRSPETEGHPWGLAWCVTCRRIYDATRARNPSPASRAASLESLRRYNATPARKEAKRAYRASPIGGLVSQLAVVRWTLRRRTSEPLKAREAALAAEIERLRGEA